jgi:hypothetical protein
MAIEQKVAVVLPSLVFPSFLASLLGFPWPWLCFLLALLACAFLACSSSLACACHLLKRWIYVVSFGE